MQNMVYIQIGSRGCVCVIVLPISCTTQVSGLANAVKHWVHYSVAGGDGLVICVSANRLTLQPGRDVDAEIQVTKPLIATL